MLAALGNPQRLGLLKAILEHPGTAAELIERVGLSSTGQAYHSLNALQSAGLIRRGEGKGFEFVGHQVSSLLMLLADVWHMLHTGYVTGTWQDVGSASSRTGTGSVANNNHGGDQPQSVSMPIEIVLASGTKAEQQAGGQLLGLFARYPLDKWRYADRVLIKEGAIPHSHPVLTLNTQYLHDPRHLLTDYIHEQLHWFALLNGVSSGAERAIEELRRAYPDLPVRHPEGCGSEESNYLHVLVCYLEYRGLSELIGSEKARTILEQKDYYRSIFRLVLDETERVGEVVERNGVLPSPLPPQQKVFVTEE